MQATEVNKRKVMPTLEQAARQALEALESWMRLAPDLALPEYSEAITALRQAPEQPKQEPVTHSVIAGALFDFMGWLTTRNERLILSSRDYSSPAVEAIKEFAKMRGLALYGALVLDWRKMTALEQPVQEPVAWTWDTKNQRDGFLDAHFQFSKPESHSLIMNLRPLYTEPPKSNWQEIDCPCCGDLARAFPPAPKREWVELTEVERQQALDAHPTALGVAYAIEAKLKEKNANV